MSYPCRSMANLSQLIHILSLSPPKKLFKTRCSMWSIVLKVMKINQEHSLWRWLIAEIWKSKCQQPYLLTLWLQWSSCLRFSSWKLSNLTLRLSWTPTDFPSYIANLSRITAGRRKSGRSWVKIIWRSWKQKSTEVQVFSWTVSSVEMAILIKLLLHRPYLVKNKNCHLHHRVTNCL